MHPKLEARLAKLAKKLAAQPDAGPAIRDLFADMEAFADALLQSANTGEPPVRPGCFTETEWNDYLQALGQRLGKPDAAEWASYLHALGCTDDIPAPRPDNSSPKRKR